MPGNKSPYATNAHNVSVRPLDYSSEHAPTTKTYHGASIVVNGNIIGRIKSWNPTGAYTREVAHVYELSNLTWGRPVDLVPGKSTTFTIAMTRTEVWNQELEIALGFGSVFNDLQDQTRPFTTYEYLYRGNVLYRGWMYTGCWFNDRNENELSAEGDGMYVANATITYVSRIKVI